MSEHSALAAVLQNAQVWRGRDIAPVRARRTSYANLDAMLPGHGWPLGALIEVMPSTEGIGELRLVVPVLRKLCAEHRDIVFIRPPHLPYPPALAQAGLPLNRIIWIETAKDDEARWAAEQILREGCTGAVLLWSDVTQDMQLRRLQLAAREGESLMFLYRPATAQALPSPASVRLLLKPAATGLQVTILKAQGGRTASIDLPIGEAA